MKRIFLVLLIGSISNGIFCQLVKNTLPTTEEEYNFLTKGYKNQLDYGGDMKKGYSLIDYKLLTISNYTFNFKKLIRSESNQLAAILVIADSRVSGSTYYLCIPNHTGI